MSKMSERKGSLLKFFKPVKLTKAAEESSVAQCDIVQPSSAELECASFCEQYDGAADVHVSKNEPKRDIMDVANFKNKLLQDSEKLDVLTNRWVPPTNHIFPMRNFGKQNRRFSHSWLQKYTWLTYSAQEDSAYCILCILFAPNEVGMTSSQSTGQFIKEGFCNWKKAIEKFDSHSQLKYHKDCIVRAANFQNVMKGNTKNIDKAINMGKDLQAKQNAERIIPIIETVILCGRQGLALRGHKDYGEFDLSCKPETNEGNFRALLRARVEAGDDKLRNHLQVCGKNATYISWNFQNQVIEACDKIIKNKIVTEVKQAKFFSVLADETTDISTTEQFTLCLRFVNHNPSDGYKICEHFLQFMPVESVTGADLANTVLKGLEECGLDPTHLRGQGYDGASAMSGKFKGVQAYIQKKHPTALYVHCASHSLNLAITNAAEVPSVRNCFGTVEKIWSFFNTPKRQNILQRCIDNDLTLETKKNKLKQLCPTRWVQRHDAVFVMKEMLRPVAAALEEIKCWDDKETSSSAGNLLNAIGHSEFLVSLTCAEKLLSYTLKLCKKLQCTDADLLAAVHYTDTVISRIESIRKNAVEEFKSLFEEAQESAEYLGMTLTMPRRVGRQPHRSNVPAESVEEFYRRAIFLPWIDSFINALHDRFAKHKHILSSFSCLLPNPCKNNIQNEEVTKKSFLNLAETYEADLTNDGKNALLAELELWHDTMNKSFSYVQNSIDALNHCDSKLFPNVHTLLKIFCTLPVSTSSAERSFSTLRRIKTYLRNTMGENRLNGLASLNIHREISVSSAEVISFLKISQKRRLDFVL